MLWVLVLLCLKIQRAIHVIVILKQMMFYITCASFRVLYNITGDESLKYLKDAFKEYANDFYCSPYGACHVDYPDDDIGYNKDLEFGI